MQSASISLKQAEKNWTDYEALPRDPRQSTAAVVEIKRNYDIYHNALVELMNRLIDSIHYIVCGDLVKPIEVDGSNEVGQLAQSLRHMQGELMRTEGGNSRQHGATDRDGEAKCRECASGQALD